ncbi:OHCU decarboxylase [Rhodococcus sp. ACPA4]|jgi:2-oxo-4-hydroxy-4-carboxy-5-ureidoimidazoline decarboxylase|uniref:2-oxo-4-hydroxy-4-carboxy-5-ureidoimidazoline decarboxylase n=1 Tax=unclassified Rhodococcus (in: high G+C Gram-positive bacteria) TaxID=192944 RepID=UPI0005D43B7F|nr:MULTISPECIES: 2-oxo-4-hydroxy-4-carboxy-5-ureidoimidazoline decarboxylase [unclassified Rhodococcus (in: high G+C Gram-positive bacteria)]PBC44384.1 OHCU decarboxylase [Rhodococcus sp. ACPA4]PSR43621.1 OHCU decarboxylase [Rhodococcus sp. AD45-ID]ROZ50951.1 2-oxo-4-hydroxy-4-carboxy-5-ureidoimidazoline decarboxylase [Rhodococcus sp. WS3]
MPTTNSSGLDAFNALADQSVRKALLDCCHSDAWANSLAAARPFASLDALLDSADSVLRDLPESEIDKALAGHPRIGERTENASSSREQAAVSTAGADVLEQLRIKNAEYEDKFSHVYLVCASGRSATELLDILQKRLENDPESERRVLRIELAAINRIRLTRLIDSLSGDDA